MGGLADRWMCQKLESGKDERMCMSCESGLTIAQQQLVNCLRPVLRMQPIQAG